MDTIEALAGINGQSIHDERLSSSIINAGHLVQQNANDTVSFHAVAGGAAQSLFALSNLAIGGTTSDAYASGESVRFGAFGKSQQVNAKVAANAAALVIGDALQSAGNGALTLRTGTNTIVGYVLEAVDNSAVASESFVKVRIV